LPKKCWNLEKIGLREVCKGFQAWISKLRILLIESYTLESTQGDSDAWAIQFHAQWFNVHS
jgi:hypothetical protein